MITTRCILSTGSTVTFSKHLSNLRNAACSGVSGCKLLTSLQVILVWNPLVETWLWSPETEFTLTCFLYYPSTYKSSSRHKNGLRALYTECMFCWVASVITLFCMHMAWAPVAFGLLSACSNLCIAPGWEWDMS